MTTRASACAAVAAALAAGGATALAGGSQHAQSATTVTRLKVTADPMGDLRFDKRRLTARHGVVSIKMVNPATSGTQHGIAISRRGFRKVGKIVDAGETSRVRATLKPGRYVFYCPVPGHRAAGMRGTLTVR
jgi:plastocyanin